MQWRLIHLETHSAAENMAIDDMLLCRAKVPTIRFYHFARPSVTYGYCQKPSLVKREQFKTDDVVRRTSSGNAVYHGVQDLTYSVFAPLDLLGGGPREAYQTVREWIIQGIHSLAPSIVKSYGKNDILDTSGKKISGNALRIHKRDGVRYVLVHGSIFTYSRPADWASALDIPLTKLEASLGTLSNHIDTPDLAVKLYDALLESFTHNIIVHDAKSDHLTKEEVLFTRDVLRKKYLNSSWLNEGEKQGTACATDIMND